jgi:hypothetical protein
MLLKNTVFCIHFVDFIGVWNSFPMELYDILVTLYMFVTSIRPFLAA